jgi:SPRY domain
MHSALSCCQVSDEERKVEYSSPRDGAGATCLRTRERIPSHCAVYMFEVEVVALSHVPSTSRMGALACLVCMPCMFVSHRRSQNRPEFNNQKSGRLQRLTERTRNFNFDCLAFRMCLHHARMILQMATSWVPMRATSLVLKTQQHVGMMTMACAALGVQYCDSNLGKLPGMERSTLGVHTADGKCYTSQQASSKAYMHYSEGDVIGVYINRVADNVVFSKNGIWMGAAMWGVPGRPMYPCLGFEGGSASVRVYFQPQDMKCATRCLSSVHRQVAYKLSLQIRLACR